MDMKFALALLDNQLITPDQFIELCRGVDRSPMPLSAVVLAEASLSMNQLRCIFEFQANRPNASFAEAALALGFLTQEELSRLAWSRAKIRSRLRT